MALAGWRSHEMLGPVREERRARAGYRRAERVRVARHVLDLVGGRRRDDALEGLQRPIELLVGALRLPLVGRACAPAQPPDRWRQSPRHSDIGGPCRRIISMRRFRGSTKAAARCSPSM